MYFKLKAAATVLLLATTPFFASAATVDLNGKMYQTVDPYKVLVNRKDPQGRPKSHISSMMSVNVSAKLGESTTQSFAIADIGDTCEAERQKAVAKSDDVYSCYWFDRFDYLDTYDSAVTGFKVSNADVVVANNKQYRVFDVMFAPTAETIVKDSNGLRYYHSTTQLDGSPLFAPDASIAIYEYDVYGLNASIDPTFLDDDQWLYTEYVPIVGTIETSSVTPVPLNGSLAFLTLGMLGMSAFARRRS